LGLSAHPVTQLTSSAQSTQNTAGVIFAHPPLDSWVMRDDGMFLHRVGSPVTVPGNYKNSLNNGDCQHSVSLSLQRTILE